MNKRKAFNFYRSFYDVYKELNEKQAKEFMDNLLAVEFLEKSIDDVVFKDKICSIVWSSIKHSIEAQIKGYAHKTGLSLENDTPTVGGTVAPYQQGEGKGEEEEQLQVCESKDSLIVEPTSEPDQQIIDEVFNYCWDIHSNRLKQLTTKDGNPRKNGNKGKTKQRFVSLLKKYSMLVLSVYVKNSTFQTYPKEFINLIGRDIDKCLLDGLSNIEDDQLEEMLDKNYDKKSFLYIIEQIEEQI